MQKYDFLKFGRKIDYFRTFYVHAEAYSASKLVQ